MIGDPHGYVVMRLQRCAIWARGNQPGPKPVRSWWGPVVMDRNVERTGRALVAPDAIEAEETYSCVLALSLELRQTVFQMHFTGGTVEQKARALGCVEKTLYNRLDRAYPALLGMFNDAAAGIPLPRPAMPAKNILHELQSGSTIPATVA